MRNLIVFFCIVLIIGGGVWWWMSRGEGDEPAQQTAELVVETTAPKSIQQPEELPIASTPPMPVVRIPEQEKPVGVDEKRQPQYMFDAYQWALDYRDALALITRLMLIENGRSILKEGEEVPDLYQVHQGLHNRIDGIELPEGQEDLLVQMQKLDAELGKIARDLSRPPTIPELEAAYERRVELDADVKQLYVLLDKL